MSSRARAVEAVEEGRVRVAGAPADSPARQVGAAEPITVVPPPDAYVSRGGHKLAAALDAFAIEVEGRSALDVGASTGGFTDCLLQRGAAHVVALDVGRAQLAWSLRNDPRVTVLERTDVRDFAGQSSGEPPDVCTVDVSFISLRTIASALLASTTPATELVLLVKPQFEAGRARVGKGGVVRDPAVHRAVLHEVVDALSAAGIGVRALVVSPLQGADGNYEFFAHARHGLATVSGDDIDAVVGDGT
ncbi:MAG: rRNA (cytidine1920-2-O)/16S rRNA (cytidine1409-2-O)-methyltransferase [Actinomycetota bacterium]|nr:rRNA (cytidine1920-2-O)/16S rRNA (cytidine1409-2-O)-methyltransferase [Actinomycetota bacterium]